MPPPRPIDSPVIELLLGENRNATSQATSSASTMRPITFSAARAASSVVRSVRVVPGCTRFTVMPAGPSWSSWPASSRRSLLRRAPSRPAYQLPRRCPRQQPRDVQHRAPRSRRSLPTPGPGDPDCKATLDQQVMAAQRARRRLTVLRRLSIAAQGSRRAGLRRPTPQARRGRPTDRWAASADQWWPGR
jgi:hypothetical protein